KSTTARMATGVLQPTEGRARRKHGLTIGYVPQKLSLDWTLPLTVSRLMSLGGRVASPAIGRAREEVGIPHLAAAQVQSLSGGEFRRALIARATVAAPDLLVMDEPVQGVDFTSEVALYDLIRRVRDRTDCG